MSRQCSSWLNSTGLALSPSLPPSLPPPPPSSPTPPVSSDAPIRPRTHTRWQRKYKEAVEREKQSRQAMESHQRNLEKLQARLINMGVTGKVCVCMRGRLPLCLPCVCFCVCMHTRVQTCTQDIFCAETRDSDMQTPSWDDLVNPLLHQVHCCGCARLHASFSLSLSVFSLSLSLSLSLSQWHTNSARSDFAKRGYRC